MEKHIFRWKHSWVWSCAFLMLLSKMHARLRRGDDMDQSDMNEGKLKKFFRNLQRENFSSREKFRIFRKFVEIWSFLRWCFVNWSKSRWKTVELMWSDERLCNKSKCENFTPFQCRRKKFRNCFKLNQKNLVESCKNQNWNLIKEPWDCHCFC